MNFLKRRLIAYNAWQLADLIALRIKAAAPPCTFEIHPADCRQCTEARLAARFVDIVRQTGSEW